MGQIRILLIIIIIIIGIRNLGQYFIKKERPVSKSEVMYLITWEHIFEHRDPKSRKRKNKTKILV